MPNAAPQWLNLIRESDRRVELFKLYQDGAGYAVNELTADELRLIIDKADVAYYRPGSSQIMPDSDYDLLRPALKQLDPNDERIGRVGLPFDAGDLRNKVKHNIPMGSLDNTDNGIAGYEPWLEDVTTKLHSAAADVVEATRQRLAAEGIVNDVPDADLPVEIFASLKVDGGSICATYENGKLVRVATRGDGETGQDITVNGANFRRLPTILPHSVSCDVRGEAVMYVADYKEVVERDAGQPFDQIPEADRSNPRNIGNGVFGRDDGQDSERITFIAFNVEFDGDEQHDAAKFHTEAEKMESLRGLGFQPVPYKVCTTVDEFNDFYTETVANRDKLPFEIDGIVVVLNEIAYHLPFITDDIKTRLRPKYARAVKFPHKSNTTTIKDVILSVGHTGGIYPTAVFEEVRIGGVNVTHALLNNWDEIERLGVAINDEVEVVLAGDIIPKVIRCVTESPNRKPIEEPKRCPSCGEPTTRNYRGKKGAVTYCSQADKCPEALKGKVDKWIGSSKKGTGILNIGDGILKAMWDNNIVSDPADLYNLKPEDLENLTLDSGGRVGRSRAETIVNNIQNKRNLKLEVFLGSLGIDLLGRRRVILLRDAAGGRLDKLEDWLDTDEFAKMEIEGLGDTIRDAVVHGIKESRGLIDKLLAVGVTIDYPAAKPAPTATTGNGQADPNLPLAGLTFCITGTRAYMDEIEAKGGVFTSGVAKSKPSPDFLIQKDATQVTNKAKNAEANGYTQIVSLAFIRKVLDGQAELPKKEPVEA